MSQRSELLSHLKAEGIDAVGYRIAVEANIFDSEGKLLLQRRGPGARDEHGKLEGVGGDLGRSTDLHQALLDRIRSEIGDAAVVHIERLFEVRPVVFEEPHGAQDWIVVSYLCRLISGTPRIVDRALTSELSRFTLDEIYALPDAQLSRSTSRFLALYRARFGTVPYFAASHG